MAFKLKSPFHVTPVGQTLGKGGTKSGYSGPSNIVSSVANIDYAETEGTQNLNPQPSNKTTEDLVKKAEKGIPENLNPKQKARKETKDYKKGLKADAKFDRQTEKAKKIYERNQFEAVGKDGAYVNPDEAAGIKSDRAEKSLERDSKFKILDSDLTFEEKEKMINDIDSKSKFSNNKIIDDEKEKTPPKDNLGAEKEEVNSIVKMKGKPNRAGTPVRMLRSVEDPTPMKYKSVRKAGRENLMSALAKQGEPVKKEMVNDFTMNMDDSTLSELPFTKPVVKQRPKKVNIKKTKPKGKSGKVTMDRKVSTKF